MSQCCQYAGSLVAEVHHLSTANTALAATNMQLQHELQQATSMQQDMIASKQVCFACHDLTDWDLFTDSTIYS